MFPSNLWGRPQKNSRGEVVLTSDALHWDKGVIIASSGVGAPRTTSTGVYTTPLGIL